MLEAHGLAHGDTEMKLPERQAETCTVDDQDHVVRLRHLMLYRRRGWGDRTDSYLCSAEGPCDEGLESAASAASLVLLLKPSFQAETEAKGENNKRYWYDKSNLEHRQPLTN